MFFFKCPMLPRDLFFLRSKTVILIKSFFFQKGGKIFFESTTKTFYLCLENPPQF